MEQESMRAKSSNHKSSKKSPDEGKSSREWILNRQPTFVESSTRFCAAYKGHWDQ